MPVILSLSIVIIVPFIYGFIYSFTNWNGMVATEFLGFKNYITLFKDAEFRASIWFTTKFAVDICHSPKLFRVRSSFTCDPKNEIK